jgi:hypothetical protein
MSHVDDDERREHTFNLRLLDSNKQLTVKDLSVLVQESIL